MWLVVEIAADDDPHVGIAREEFAEDTRGVLSFGEATGSGCVATEAGGGVKIKDVQLGESLRAEADIEEIATEVDLGTVGEGEALVLEGRGRVDRDTTKEGDVDAAIADMAVVPFDKDNVLIFEAIEVGGIEFGKEVTIFDFLEKKDIGVDRLDDTGEGVEGA